MAALVARRALTRGCFVGRKAFRYSSPIRSLFRGNRSSFGVDFAETLSTMECSIMAIEGATTSEFTLSKFVSARDRGRFETWQHKQSPPFANIKYKNAYTRDTKRTTCADLSFSRVLSIHRTKDTWVWLKVAFKF